MPRIEIYSSPWCPWCWKARLLLRGKGVRFEKIPIRMYLGIKLPTANLRTMIERTGGDSTVPQIFIDGRYLGTDDTLDELDRKGVDSQTSCRASPRHRHARPEAGGRATTSLSSTRSLPIRLIYLFPLEIP